MNRELSTDYVAWAEGYGVIRHAPETRERAQQLGYLLVECGQIPDVDAFYRLLAAADRLSSAAMWTVAHMTYAQRVDLSGAPLPADAFKKTPEGHTGGSLNMVPAFVGYLGTSPFCRRDRGGQRVDGGCFSCAEGPL